MVGDLEVTMDGDNYPEVIWMDQYALKHCFRKCEVSSPKIQKYHNDKVLQSAYDEMGAIQALCEVARTREKILQEENDRLKVVNNMCAQSDVMLMSENYRLKQALEFYANKQNYRTVFIKTRSGYEPNEGPAIETDEGQCARDALNPSLCKVGNDG